MTNNNFHIMKFDHTELKKTSRRCNPNSSHMCKVGLLIQLWCYFTILVVPAHAAGLYGGKHHSCQSPTILGDLTSIKRISRSKIKQTPLTSRIGGAMRRNNQYNTISATTAFLSSPLSRAGDNTRHNKFTPKTIKYNNNPPSNILKYKQQNPSKSKLQMSLIPIPKSSLQQLLQTQSLLPTSAQYATYWGRTSREQYNALFEAFGVSFLGVFAAYFLSFAFGTFIGTILGMIAGFWVLLGPEFKAYQRNWELLGGRPIVDPYQTSHNDDSFSWNDDDDDEEQSKGLYGAFYFGRIHRVSVVEDPNVPPQEEYRLEDFEGYTMESDEMEKLTGLPYKLRLCVKDDGNDYFDNDEIGEQQKAGGSGSGGRELQVHARMSEEYLSLAAGMPVCAVLLSTSQSFETLSGLTDFCVPDGGENGEPCWVGDYPYLDRPILEGMLVGDDELWDALREEGRGYWDVDNDNGYDYGDDDDDKGLEIDDNDSRKGDKSRYDDDYYY